jgi:hypothetical protein
MRILRVSRYAIVLCAAAMISAYGGNGVALRNPEPMTPLLFPAPQAATSGLYVGDFDATTIYGYRARNPRNKPPICTVPGVSYVNGLAVDGKGNLIDPDGGTRKVIVFKGPGMCGATMASISDPYGMPSDAASADASAGAIVVGNIFDGPGSHPTAGSISICTVAVGCVQNLTNPHMYEVVGVALARNGDCWADASATSSGSSGPRLIYFKSCSGSGQVAKDFLNKDYGGLDIDGNGNLLSIAYSQSSKLYVYHGCNPRCSLVAGPFRLHGPSVYGKVDQDSTHFAAADVTHEQVDVYSYSRTSVRYRYSFWNGLNRSGAIEGIAYNPRSKE